MNERVITPWEGVETEVLCAFSLGAIAAPATASCREELILKVGARVIFIRNDRHRRWVNGTTGVATHLDEDEIGVTTDAGDELAVAF
jgi:hypothetical protein